jgi:hypothetical protein
MSPAQKIANFIAAKTGASAGTSPPPAFPAETLEATTFQPDAPESEAHRIAAELVRLHGDGAIGSHNDASFYAYLLRDFDATYTGPARSVRADPPGPYVPTAMQRVHVPRGLTVEERQRFLRKDLEDAISYIEEIAVLPPIVMDLFAPRRQRR